MAGLRQRSKLSRSLILFPSPFQGHVTPMYHLASLLYSKGFSITVIQTRYNSVNPTHFPHFTFHFLEDGLVSTLSTSPPPDSIVVLSTLNIRCLEPFHDCLNQILSEDASKQEPVACLIADNLWFFAGSVADSFNLPRIMLSTGSMSTLAVYNSLQSLREKGYYPLQEASLDELLVEFPPLRVEDLPSESLHNLLDALVKETKTSQGIICNTFEELEGSSIARVGGVLTVPIFPIGPIHKHSPTSTVSIWTQDQTSITWLNSQAPKSVLYVSFGSVAAMSETEFLEIAWALVKSMQPFLWVVRPGLIRGSEANDPLPQGYMEMVGERAHVVKWAPQIEVLSHPAVGGFFTHSGWNSTVESICEGVPMLCLPLFADQAVNARHVSDNWKIGLKLENGVTREEIASAIGKLMVEEGGDEMRSRITTLKDEAKLCVMEGGSSYKSLERLTSYLLSF